MAKKKRAIWQKERAPWQTREILEIRPGANDAEIDAAYKRTAMSAHSDRGGSSAAMAELTEARRKEQAA